MTHLKKCEASRWKMAMFFFEVAFDFWSVGNSRIETDKWIDGKQIAHFLQSVPAAIIWHQTMRCKRWGENSTRGRVRENIKGERTHFLRALLCPMDPAPCSIVTLMKSRPQSLSIWPAWHSPVKGNRLAEQRHYITICRCRQAQQRRDMAP